jgi:hypothetical protein
MTRATHYGHCQWCDRRQKLPGGVLSLHGYEVRWNSFQGKCFGSGHPPFEKSKALIDDAIAWAKRQRAETTAQRQQVLAQAKSAATHGWRHVYHAELGRRLGRPVYLWEFGEYQVDDRGFVTTFVYGDKIDRVYGGGSPIAAFVSDGYAGYARHLADHVKELDKYIAWQQERIAGWVEQELEPIAGVAA